MLAAVPVQSSSGQSSNGQSSRAPGRAGRRRGPARALIVLALAILTVAGLSGCAAFDKALGQQEEVIVFQPNVSNAVKMKVRAACSHIPNIDVEPLPAVHNLADEIYGVRYQVGSASEVELAEFDQCVNKFPPSVIQGIETETPGGDD
jgi:hypothetical protein